MTQLLLHLCKDCLKAPGDAQAALQNAVEKGMPGQVTVRLSACLERCDTPVALAMQRESGAGYVFSGVDPVADQDDIVATCQTYLESPAGWIEDARPCGRLRFCLAARLPA